MQKFKAVVVLSLMFLAGCSGQHDPNSSSSGNTNSGVEIDGLPLSFKGVTDGVFKAKCIDCHGAVRIINGQPVKVTKDDIDLTDYESLFGQRGLIVPGNPEKSVIIKVIEQGLMPDDERPRVTAEELQFLKEWILAQAPEKEGDTQIVPPVITEPETEPTVPLEPPPPAIPPTDPVVPTLPTDPGPVETGKIMTYAEIYTNILEPKCSRCHSGPLAESFVDVTDIESLKNNFMFPDLIKKGSPFESRLYRVVDSGFMPRRAPRLSEDELRDLRLWIYEGPEL